MPSYDDGGHGDVRRARPGPVARVTMATEERRKEVNLYFGSQQELGEVLKKDDASLSYILLQNDRLHAKVERLERKVRDVERDRDGAVGDGERAERSRVCLRGMLHNEIEKSSLYEELVAELRGASESVAMSHEYLKARMTGAVAAGFLLHCLASAFERAHLPVLAMHLGNATFAVWMLYCGWDARPSDAPGRLLARIGEANRATEHLHGIVDEL